MSTVLRKDLSVYNETTLFVIASKKLGGEDCAHEPGDEEWNALVRAGVFLPIELTGDAGINVRVILGDDLTPDELGEAAAHFAARLRVGDGKLALLGGREHLEGEDAEDAMELVKVPKGDYRADVYALFAGVNGPDLVHYRSAAGEPVGAWFRRTRPEVEPPRWLADHLRDHPDNDPGHADDWKRSAAALRGEPYAERPEYLDFILRLTPWPDGSALDPLQLDENGCIVPTAMVPKHCPVGIVSTASA